MANLDKFTIDEQLILIHITYIGILGSAVVQSTNENVESLKTDIAIMCGKSIAELDERRAKKIIEDARNQNLDGMKQLQRDIAEGKI